MKVQVTAWQGKSRELSCTGTVAAQCRHEKVPHAAALRIMISWRHERRRRFAMDPRIRPWDDLGKWHDRLDGSREVGIQTALQPCLIGAACSQQTQNNHKKLAESVPEIQTALQLRPASITGYSQN